MCVVSMIMDHYFDEWWRKLPPQPSPWVVPQPYPTVSPTYIPPIVPAITPEEIAEFRRLLDRAREYDKRNNEPDCEMESKRQKLKELAKELGVEINFV